VLKGYNLLPQKSAYFYTSSTYLLNVDIDIANTSSVLYEFCIEIEKVLLEHHYCKLFMSICCYCYFYNFITTKFSHFTNFQFCIPI